MVAISITSSLLHPSGNRLYTSFATPFLRFRSRRVYLRSLWHFLLISIRSKPTELYVKVIKKRLCKRSSYSVSYCITLTKSLVILLLSQLNLPEKHTKLGYDAINCFFYGAVIKRQTSLDFSAARMQFSCISLVLKRTLAQKQEGIFIHTTKSEQFIKPKITKWS